ncbi:caspase family protein [Roseibium sp.]|uniref:caspase family protein n=3 Tax=Roseibium sp. TaxID=1936156 RepID=UPI00326305FD
MKPLFTRRFRLVMAACFFICSPLFGPAFAAERLALVVGNADYDSATLTRLQNPANDAALITDSLKSTGFEVDLVLNADLRTMKRAVRDFADKLKKTDPGAIAVVYYSGHGFEAGGQNYLAPLGADLRDEIDAEFEALSVDWVLSAVESAHDGANIVIFDACRNTALSRSAGGTVGGFAFLNSTPRGSFISFATAPGSTATDGTGLNSPYTLAISREIRVPGATVETVFKRVRKQVVEATNGDQVPWDHSSLTADIVLTPSDITDQNQVAANVPADASTIQLELQFWNDVKASDDRSQIQAYLDRFPGGSFSELAKARLAQIGSSPAGEIEQLFAKLQSRSLLVENPQSPLEFYANARMREIKGDYPKARQDYLKYFAFGEPQVDPHIRFQAVLRAQEGRAGAREFYHSLTQGRSDPTTLFAEILLQERDERIRRFSAFVDAYPEFVPALYELSLDYSQSRLGQQSMADKTTELDLLTRFLEGVEDGRYLRYFIDQQMAAQRIEDAKSRLAALSGLNTQALANPVKLNAMRSNQGWMLSLAIADSAQEIFVRLPGEDFRSTGFVNGALNPTTGQPIPYPGFELPGNAGPTDVEVQYTDVHGDVRGPFKIAFNPNAALIKSQKDILERLSNGWISYQDWDGKQLAYFTQLISYRCAIASVRYAVNSDQPDTAFEIGECDPDNPHAIPRSGPGSVVFANIPKSTEYVSVQLTYADGTTSDVKRFDAPK